MTKSKVDTKALEDWIDFKPSTPVDLGISRFAKWFRDFYGI